MNVRAWEEGRRIFFLPPCDALRAHRMRPSGEARAPLRCVGHRVGRGVRVRIGARRPTCDRARRRAPHDAQPQPQPQTRVRACVRAVLAHALARPITPMAVAKGPCGAGKAPRRRDVRAPANGRRSPCLRSARIPACVRWPRDAMPLPRAARPSASMRLDGVTSSGFARAAASGRRGAWPASARVGRRGSVRGVPARQDWHHGFGRQAPAVGEWRAWGTKDGTLAPDVAQAVAHPAAWRGRPRHAASGGGGRGADNKKPRIAAGFFVCNWRSGRDSNPRPPA